jgi:hypothetical protein|eukprot:COSAG01_NODE_259_length_20069_cov_21.507762_14_plen_126_part_00
MAKYIVAHNISHIGAMAWLAFIQPPSRIANIATSRRVAFPANTDCMSPMLTRFQAMARHAVASTRVGQRQRAQASCPTTQRIKSETAVVQEGLIRQEASQRAPLATGTTHRGHRVAPRERAICGG